MEFVLVLIVIVMGLALVIETALLLGKRKGGSSLISAISVANGLLMPCTMRRYWSAWSALPTKQNQNTARIVVQKSKNP